MITGMNHVAISVSNLERAIAFYREILGLELASPIIPFKGPMFAQIQALENPEGRIGFMTGPGNLQIELFEFSNPSPAPKDPNYSVADRGITHFCVDVTDIEMEYERMLAAGVRFHCPVMTFHGVGTKAAYARDLDGNVFELVERSKASDEANA